MSTIPGVHPPLPPIRHTRGAERLTCDRVQKIESRSEEMPVEKDDRKERRDDLQSCHPCEEETLRAYPEDGEHEDQTPGAQEDVVKKNLIDLTSEDPSSLTQDSEFSAVRLIIASEQGFQIRNHIIQKLIFT